MIPHENIKAYLDGELLPDEVATFETALATDPDLADRVASFRQIGDSLRAYAGRTQPHGMEATLMRLRPAGRSGRSWRGRWTLALTGVLALLLVLARPLVDRPAGARFQADDSAAGSEGAASSVPSEAPTERAELAAKASSSPKTAQAGRASVGADSIVVVAIRRILADLRTDDPKAVREGVRRSALAFDSGEATEIAGGFILRIPSAAVDPFIAGLRDLGSVVVADDQSEAADAIRDQVERSLRRYRAEAARLSKAPRGSRNASQLSQLNTQIALAEAHLKAADTKSNQAVIRLRIIAK